MADLGALRAAITAAMTVEDHQPGESAVAVSKACTVAMPSDGAAITLMTSDARRETLFASDEVIDQVERAQYSLGEGPSLLAFTTRRPVLIPDAAAPSVAARWPVLAGELAQLPVGALFVFPMRFGAIPLGVCPLYRRLPVGLTRPELAQALSALDLTTLALLELREGHPARGVDGGWLEGAGLASAHVHQATGMLVVQLGVDAQTAFARLRGHAFATGRCVELVADDIVGRRLRLAPEPPARGQPKAGPFRE